jgi:hypothetical protein
MAQACEASFHYPLDKQNFKNNEEAKIPGSFAGLIVGKRNCGKTHLLFKLLLEGYIDYNRLYIFSPSIYQSEYQLIIEGLKQHLMPQDIWTIFQNIETFKEIDLKEPKDIVKGLVDNYEEADPEGKWKSKIEVFPFKDRAAIPRPEEVDKKFKNLFIFDDCMGEQQKEIESYYTRGRHSSVQCIYIAQSYFELPKRTIRDNSSLIILFQQPSINWSNIHQQLAANDIEDYKKFKIFAQRVWSEEHGFMVIDTDNKDINWKFRKGFYTPFSEVINEANFPSSNTINNSK